MKDYGSRDRDARIVTPAAVRQRKRRGGGFALAGPDHEKLNALQQIIAAGTRHPLQRVPMRGDEDKPGQLKKGEDEIRNGENQQDGEILRGKHGQPPIFPIVTCETNDGDVVTAKAAGSLRPSNPTAGVIQRVNIVNVTNRNNNYDSGWVQAETRSTGVDDEPQREAQEVKGIAGGSWVGGHMVNDRLGGTGGFNNIVPITSSMNTKHHTIENAAQRIVGNGGTDYEVRYYMKILNRTNYTFTPKMDKVNNLPDKFQQSYNYRTKAVNAGGTRSRPILYQPPGKITKVTGKALNPSFRKR